MTGVLGTFDLVELSHSLREISIYSFAAVFVLIVLHYFVRRPRAAVLFGRDRGGILFDPVRRVLLPLLGLLPRKEHQGLSVLRHLCFLGALLFFVISCTSAFWQRLLYGLKITGYFQTVHIASSMGFVTCILAGALLSAPAFVFRSEDNPWPLGRLKEPGKICGLLIKALFWVILFLAMVVILTIVLSMLPVFGTHAQESLIALHRLAGLDLAICSVLFVYNLFWKWMNENSASVR